MKLAVYITISFTFISNLFAQTDVKLKINHKLGDKDFAFQTEATNDLNHKFNVSRLEYYLSDISVTHDGGKVSAANDVYVLVNGGNGLNTLLGNWDITTVEAISFSVGVSPKVNNADPTLWPSGHALAPKSPSMHWGWSAGYRFVAMEGKSGNDLSLAFEVHALGNINYFKQRIPVSAEKVGNELIISLNADYAKALKGIPVNSGLINHGEDDEAAYVLRNFQMNVFTSLDGKGNTLHVDKVGSMSNLLVYPNPSQGKIHLQGVTALGETSKYKIQNMAGMVIQEGNATNEIQIDKKGVYILTLTSDHNSVQTERLIIQ